MQLPHRAMLAAGIVIVMGGVWSYALSRLAGSASTPPSSRGIAASPLPKEASLLSSDAYYALEEELVELLTRENPRVALEELTQRIETDAASLRACHPITHTLGHAAYRKYGNFTRAAAYSDATCNTGFLHGVVEAYFSQAGDIAEVMYTVCNGQDYGRCFHAVGHGLMYYAQNDLPRALALCRTYKEARAQQFCTQGVFMENFTTDEDIHPTQFRDPLNPFFPCDEQTGATKAICAFYAPAFFLALHEYDFPLAFAWCNAVARTEADACVRGAASVAIKMNMRDPKYVETLCEGVDPAYIAHCIDGMVGTYVNHFDSPQKGFALCATLKREHQRTCETSVQERLSLFTD